MTQPTLKKICRRATLSPYIFTRFRLRQKWVGKRLSKRAAWIGKGEPKGALTDSRSLPPPHPSEGPGEGRAAGSQADPARLLRARVGRKERHEADLGPSDGTSIWRKHQPRR